MTAAVVLVLSHAHDKVAAMHHIFLVNALLMLALVPLTYLLPDGSRRRQPQEAQPVTAGTGA